MGELTLIEIERLSDKQREELRKKHKARRSYVFWEDFYPSISSLESSYLHQDNVMDYINEHFADTDEETFDILSMEFSYGGMSPDLITYVRLWIKSTKRAGTL